MKIICHQCNESVLSPNMDFINKIAKCVNCDIIFSFQDQLLDKNKNNKKNLLLPKGLELEDDGTQLIIRRKWFGPKSIILAAVAFFWNCIVTFFILVYLDFEDGYFPFTNHISLTLFGSLFVIVGIVLTYCSIAGYINTTAITVTPLILRVRNYPLPFPGNEEGPSKGIEQLFVKEIVASRSSSGPVSFAYAVHLISQTRQDIELIVLDRKDHAQYIEQAVEKYLKIKDKKASGEILN